MKQYLKKKDESRKEREERREKGETKYHQIVFRMANSALHQRTKKRRLQEG